MWIMTTDGFFSAVQHRDEPETLLIRARDRADLETLLVRNPWLNAAIIDDEPFTSDYPARIFVSKSDWEVVLAEAVRDMDYANFKDAVTARQGKFRHDVYLSVWAVLRRLTPGREVDREDREDDRQGRIWDRWFEEGIPFDDDPFGEYDDTVDLGPLPTPMRRLGARFRPGQRFRPYTPNRKG